MEKAKIIDPIDKEDLSDDDGLGSDVPTSESTIDKDEEIDIKVKNENAGANGDVLEIADIATKNEANQETSLVLDCADPVVKNVQDLFDLFDPTLNFNSYITTRNDLKTDNNNDKEEQGESGEDFESVDHNDSKEFANFVKLNRVCCVQGAEKGDLQGGGHFTGPVALNSVNPGELNTHLDQDHQSQTLRSIYVPKVGIGDAGTEIRLVLAGTEQDCSANYVESVQAEKEVRHDCVSDIATLNFVNTLETNPALEQDYIALNLNPSSTSKLGDDNVDLSEHAHGLENSTSQDHLTPQTHPDFIPKITNENVNLNNITFLDNDRNFENVNIFEQNYGNLIDGEIFDLVDTNNPNCFVERLNSAYLTIDPLICQSPSSLDTLEIGDLFFGGSRSNELGFDHQEDLDDPNVGENQAVDSLNEFVENYSLSGDPDLEALDDGENQNGSDVATPSESVSSYDSLSANQDLDDPEKGVNQNDSDEPLSAEEERARLRALNLILKFNHQTGYV